MKNKLIEKILSEANANKFKIGVYADFCNDENKRILINANDLFPIASTYKINLIIDTLIQIEKGIISKETRISLKQYHKAKYGNISKIDINSDISLENILSEICSGSDNTATDLLGEYLGWENVLKHMPSWGVTETKYLYPTKLATMLYGNLWKELKGKTIDEQVIFWNALSPSLKMEVALKNYRNLKNTSNEEIQNYCDNYFNFTPEAEKKLLQAFCWSGTPREYGEVVKMATQGTLFNSQVSEKFVHYLSLGGEGLIGKKVRCLRDNFISIGRKGGSDEGVRCDVGFFKFGQNRTVCLAIMLTEQTNEEDRINEMDDFISKTSFDIFNHYLEE